MTTDIANDPIEAEIRRAEALVIRWASDLARDPRDNWARQKLEQARQRWARAVGRRDMLAAGIDPDGPVVELRPKRARYYGCTRCQRNHDEGSELYEAHLPWQSKHGIQERTDNRTWAK